MMIYGGSMMTYDGSMMIYGGPMRSEAIFSVHTLYIYIINIDNTV